MSRFATSSKLVSILRLPMQLTASCLLILLFLMSATNASSADPRQDNSANFIDDLVVGNADAETAVQDAWELAQASGTYKFTSDIVQITTPVATAVNAGRQGERQTMYLEGETNLPEQALQLTLWNQGGTVMDGATAVQVRVNGDEAFIRQGTQSWQEVNDFTSFFAPNADFMSYLVAAKNIREIGTESRAGIEFTRFAFELDGPGYANYMREQMEAQLHASGELPADMSLAPSQQYMEMTGSGELWITADGWPLRQIIHMDLPANNESQVSADITVNFSDFDMVGATAVTTPTTLLTNQITQLKAIDPAVPLVALASLFASIGFLWLLYRSLRSRKIFAALNLVIILSMLGAPWLRDVKAHEFANSQAAKAQEQKASSGNNNIPQDMAEKLDTANELSHERLAVLETDNGSDMDADGLTDAEERLMGTNPLSSPLFAEPNQALDPIPPNNNDDFDQDGLTDYVEYLVNTSFENPDTDTDGITDDKEVLGFQYGSQQWFTNPHLVDSNGDGLSDTEEWGDLDSSTRPDTDGDLIPDLFDPDNDNDGVPDSLDLSPYFYEDDQTRKVYSDNVPLDLVINNLTPDEFVYVEFQLRPTNPNHLWYAFNVLDWPQGDKQASIQDADGGTFSDIDSTLTPLPHENGDIKLIPVLEIILPQQGNNLPDEADWKEYNVEISDLPDPSDGKVAYVPIQIVTDPTSGEQVAFYAKMPYLPDEEWGEAHHVRLVWVVQALVDVCDEYYETGECKTYAAYNQVNIIQSYPDEWSLTGLAVRENIESKTATIFEDPGIDNDFENDDALWQMTLSLDEFFLGAHTVPDNQGIAEREITVDTIYERFDHATSTSTAAERWDFDPVFTVVEDTYEHIDKALFTQAKETNQEILATRFAGATAFNPTLLFAREDTYRSLNLNEMQRGLPQLFQQEGEQLTIDMDPKSVQSTTMASLKWSPYEYTNGAWNEMPIDQYWQVLAQRHQAEFVQELGAEDAEGGLFFAQLLYMSYHNGLVSVVEINHSILEKDYFTGDRPTWASGSLVGRAFVLIAVNKAVEVLGTGVYADLILFRDYGGLSSKPGAARNLLNPWGTVKLLFKWVTTSPKNAAIFVTVVLTLATLAVLSALYIDEPGVRITLAVLVLIVGTIYLVVKPVIALINIAKGMIEIGKATTLSGGVLAAVQGAENVNKGLKWAAVVGLVISVGIALGIFIWAVSEGNVPAGSPEYKLLVTQLLASIIVAVIIMALSFTLVGLIVVGIITVIDLFLFALGSDFSITGALTDAIAEAFFDFQLMVKSPEVTTGNIQLDFIGDGAGQGLVAGNPIKISLGVTTTITHTTPRGLVEVSNGTRFFTERNLRSVTFQHQLNTFPLELSVNRGEMRDEWDDIVLLEGNKYDEQRELDYKENAYYGGSNSQLPSIVLSPDAGINVSTPIYLNTGYALPGVSCAYVFITVDCDTHTLRGNSSSDIGSSLVLDVLPATLDGFYAMDWGGTRPFPEQRDHDGDGLIAKAFAGADPNDSISDCNGGVCWDSDNDGLSDKKEVQLQADGYRNSPGIADLDLDGLCDAEEIRIGTDPQKRDTDGDGLTDAQETWHYNCHDNSWGGGWEFDFENKGTTYTILMFSDPFTTDLDGDGLSDLAEKQLSETGSGVDANGLHYHPAIPNDNPLKLQVQLSDPVVGPGQMFTVTTTVRNDSSQWAYGVMTTTIPFNADLNITGALTETMPNLNVGESYQQIIPLTVDSDAISNTLTFTANAGAGGNNGSIEPTWEWLTSNASPVNTFAYGVALTELPAAAANQAGRPAYSAATLEEPGTRNLSSITPLVPANGFNRQIEFDSYGTAVEINRDPVTIPAEYNSNLAADTPPDVVCNDAGVCFAVSTSAYWYNCETTSLISVGVIKENDDQGGAGSEFYIHKNGRDWNTSFNHANGELIWNLPQTFTGDQPGPNPLITFNWCEGDTLDLWEGDGDGYKDDDQMCSFILSDGVPTPFFDATILQFTCTPNSSNEIEINVAIESPNIAPVSPQWQGHRGSYCTVMTIDQLIAIKTNDRGDGPNEDHPSEYYIQRNGTNRGSRSSNNAEGTRIWTYSSSVATGDPPVSVNTSFLACRGDTINIWEDDPGAEDDFICSIPVLGNTPANPTTGNLDRSTESNSAVGLAELGWNSGDICRNASDNTRLDLTIKVPPNPKYVVTGGLFNAAGNTTHTGIVVGPSRSFPTSSGTNYFPGFIAYTNPAVASDGTNFLTAWVTSDGYVQLRKTNADGSQPASQPAYVSGIGTSATDVDLVWVGNKYLVTVGVANKDIYAFYVNQNGAQVGSPVQIAPAGQNEQLPDLAFNPLTNEAMLVYVNRSNNTVYGRIITHNATNPTIAPTPVAIYTTTNVINPEVAYDAGNNIWIVSWTNANTRVIQYRALKSDGTLFDTAVLPVSNAPSQAGFNLNASLACDQKTGENSACAIAYNSSNQLRLHTLQALKTSLSLNGFTPSASSPLIIDSFGPTTTLSLPDDQVITISGNSILLTGNAKDDFSNVENIQIRFDGGSFTDVTDGPDENTQKEAWSHNWTSPTGGAHTIDIYLRDSSGNETTQSFSATVDSIAPTISSDTADNTLLPAVDDGNGAWSVALSGSVSDDTGVTAVIATTQHGDEPATLNCSSSTSCTWTVNYPLPTFDASSGLTGPSGTYTANLRAVDDIDQTSDLSITFRVDEAAPVTELLVPDPLTFAPVITTPLTLSGVITDPGQVASGVQSLQIELVDTTTGITPTWQTAVNATLDTVGAVSTGWSYALPANIAEGSYAIMLRGADSAQNVNNNESTWFTGWQGIIDTQAPAANVTITPVGRGSSTKYNISATVTDAFLDGGSWSFICDIQNGDRTTVTDTLLSGDSLNERLVGLDVSCQVNAQKITGPIVLQVSDIHGHQTTVSTPLPQSSTAAQTSLARTSLAQTSLANTTTAAAAVIASTVLTPTNDSVLTSYDPVTITGAAASEVNLSDLTLSINGTEVYTESWASQTITDTLWTTTWAPPADGVYELTSVATDQNGTIQTELLPVTITVDTQPPGVTLDTNVLTETHQIAVELVELTGTLTENLTVENVLVSVDGAQAEQADFDATTWRYVWPVAVADDGTIYNVAVSASDGSNVTTITETVTVDLVPPVEITPTLKATGGSTPVIVTGGDTVRDPAATTLVLDWSASSDGSGIALYEADWNQSLTPDLGSMTTVLPTASLTVQEAGAEATAWLTHLRIIDGVGNSTLQTEGPIYLDAPTTPDYINPVDGLTTNIYRGWMDSGCSQIGADYEIFRNALSGNTLTAVQEMYLTWDANNLRLAWSGANWDVDGDLYIYLDTVSGGSTTAYNPYGTPVTIDFPTEGSSQFGADYMIQIEDSSAAILFSWDGSGWIEDQTLGTPNFLAGDSITDLYLPLNWLGSPAQMKMVALASEEDDLHLWTAMPDKNPLNSELVTSSAARPFLDMPFSLLHHYEWTNIGAAGVCPAAGQFENADLTISITSTPTGAEVGYLAQDLSGLLQNSGLPAVQLDSNTNGIADLNEDGDSATYLPLDTDPSPIGPGGVATYTLRIANDGSADATGVEVTLNAYGAMSLSSGTTTPVTLGTIAAGSFVEHTFSVVVDSSATIDGGEVTAVVSDATHGAFDWLWVLYEIDHEAPTDVTITGPKYINPGLNQIHGVVSDASDVPTIILQEVGGSGSSVTCTDSTPADGSWICVWDAAGATSATIDLHARGVDEWGNGSASTTFGPTFTFILDDEPPTISLNAASTAALNDGLLLDGELLMQGVVSDTNLPAFAELCAQEATETEPTCTAIEVNPSTGNWAGTIPANVNADGDTYTITFTGIDAAGNRSETPLTFNNIVVDTTGPDINVTTFVQTPIQNVTTDVLGGSIVDGSGIASMSMWISRIDGTESIFKDDIRSGQSWLYTRAFSQLGKYSISITATDVHGNAVNAGPFTLTVIPSTANLPPTIGLGAGYSVEEGSTIVLNANATDPNGDTLTIEWDLDDDGSYEMSGETATFDATAIDAPATPQEAIVSVRVSDGVNSPVEASTTVSIVNAAPVLNNVSATAITENGTTTLTGTMSDPAAADSFTLDVDWGDGSAVESVSYASGTTTFSLSHQYLDDNPSGTQVDNISISLYLNDDDGGITQSTTTVQASNSPPALSNVTATAIDENGTTTLAGAIADAGTLDNFVLTVDWGDGSAIDVFDYNEGATSFSETHQYLDDNPTGTAVDEYTITLTLQDDDLGSSEASTAVTVTNLNPTLSNVAITNVNEDDVATLTGTITDAGTEDSYTLAVDWGDGTAVSTFSYPVGTSVFTETHRYLDDNPTGTSADDYTVNLTLTDDDTGMATDITTVTITNLNPTLSNVAITNVDENGVATLSGDLADAGTQDSFTLDVDWGDGTAVSTFSYPAGTTSFSEAHQYLDDNPTGTAFDDYSVNLTLTDDDTGSTTDNVTVTVTNLAPTLSNIAITDVDEDGVAILTGNLADAGTQDNFTLEVDWGDGTAVSTYSYPAGTTSFSETHQYLDDNPSGTSADDYTVRLTLTDDDTDSATDSVTVTVTNLNPTLSNITITDVDEDGVATLTGNLADSGTEDSFTLEVDWGDSSPVSSYSYPAGTTTFTATHRYLDDNPSGTSSDPYSVTLTLTDDDSDSTTGSTIVTVSNVAPVLAIDVLTQTVQYSDGITGITITGTDVADDPLQASTSWNLDGGAFVAGLPAGMSLSTNTCFFSGNGRTCSWTISGIADVIAGTYILRVTVEDDDLGQITIDHTVEVVEEDTSLSFDGDNPVAVQVDAPGSDASEPFSLVVLVEELEPDLAAYLPAPGNINLAQVSIILEPVGPGSPATGVCTPDPVNPVTGYDDVLTVTCDFDGVPVNTYSVSLIIDGGYYTGYSEDAIVIYDPSLGFTTGGGWFYWPGSEDPASGYPGDKTNFGFTMKYNKPRTNIQGNLLLIRHLPDGTIYRLKSNAIEGLALGDAGFFGWASFSGKGTYLEPGWPEPVGNHTFLFYVEDHNEPGNGIDRVWVEVRDKDDIVIPAMSMLRPGSANALAISGGNIVVPHSGGTGNQSPAADFSFTTAGLQATFTDESSDPGGSIVAWAWDFGDGVNDTIQHPTHTYAVGGAYDVSLTVTDNEGAQSTTTQQVVVSTGGGSGEMFIGDLQGFSTPENGNKWMAEVDILVLDDQGSPVANAQVTGSWSSGTSGTSTCLTDSNGRCPVTKSNINGNRDSVTFTIDGVNHVSLVYNQLLNAVTFIVVPKPA